MLLLLAILSLLVSLGLSSPTTVSIIKNSVQQYEITDGSHPDAIVVSTFDNTYNQTGWATLEINGVPGHTDEDLAYSAGLIEGYQTADLIYMTYFNSFGKEMCLNGSIGSSSKLCHQLDVFIQANLDYMNDQIKRNPGSAYWHQVDLYMRQLKGLENGYYTKSDVAPLPKNAMLYLQIDNDLGNLKDAFQSGKFPKVNADVAAGKCSALIKLLPDNSDLLTTHDTWSEYQSMLRVFKLYYLPYNQSSVSNATVMGSAISMSSYPGKLQSEDDYYIINSGLVTMETTNGNINPALWEDLTPSSVMEPIRVMVANRLSNSGREWTQTFARYNSGTYNNQWMIVDYNHFQPGATLPSSDLLWILEQLPGYIMYGDETRVLVEKSYWASYNIPYYESIFEASGLPAMVKKYGDWFTHEGAPRAKIFARNHTDVTDMRSLIDLMRYNNFEHDPLSACDCTPPYSGENAISARSDLNPRDGKYPFPELAHRIHGGTDNKATSYQLVQQLSAIATCGPTHAQQPVFKWSESGETTPLGHPDAFDFPTVQIKWSKQ